MLSGLLLGGDAAGVCLERAGQEEASIKPLSKERSWEEGLELRCLGISGIVLLSVVL